MSSTTKLPPDYFKKQTAPTVIRFTHKRLEAIDQIAQSRKMKRCDVIREAVEFYLANSQN